METMNIEMETHGGSTVETTTNEEQHKGWRMVLEQVGSWLSYKDKNIWLEELRGNLGLIATVIATIAFQMALNPPGGVRSISDGLSCDLSGYGTLQLCPGESVLAVVYEDLYFRFLISNKVCFIASLCILLLLVSGIPLHHRLPMWMLSIGMWVTLTALAISYITAVNMTTPDAMYVKAGNCLRLIGALLILLGIIALFHTLRMVIWVVKFFLKRSKNKSIRSYSSITRQRVIELKN